MHSLWNIPNLLTLLRVILIPLLVVVFYLPYSWAHFVAAFLFILAAVTDWLDGYLARRLGQTSPFGAFLDPVADKLVVIVVLVLLVEQQATLWFTIPALVIIARELFVSALREWMAETGNRTRVAVSYIGKVKTTVQMLALIALLVFPPETGLAFLRGIGFILLYGSVVLTLWSMVIYLKAAMKVGAATN